MTKVSCTALNFSIIFSDLIESILMTSLYSVNVFVCLQEDNETQAKRIRNFRIFMRSKGQLPPACVWLILLILHH
jgi:hypothetical protein